MEREGLERLSREELLERLTQQAEEIGRQRQELAAREAAIERRDEQIRELEEELAQSRRPAKTPENSSVPPARGQPDAERAGCGHRVSPEHLCGVWRRPAADRGTAGRAEPGHRPAADGAGGDRSAAVRAELCPVW